MFVRVKTSNKGQTRFVQIVQSIRKGDKVSQRIVRHIGVACDDGELEALKLLAESIKIGLEAGAQELIFKPEELARMGRDAREIYPDEDYSLDIRDLIEEQRLIAGIHEAYGKLFDGLGYGKVIRRPSRNKMMANIFRDIVLARIANPVSKRASVDMLEENFGITIDLDKVYRMMDKLDDAAIERLKDITYANTASLFPQKINVIFYDATTIYFESFTPDELRREGYSKDHKFGQPQVLLALMVTSDGLPVSYSVFEGDRYEGHTLLPALQEIKANYDVDKVIFVADSAMLSKDNIKILEDAGFEYIVGARLRSLPGGLTERILDKANYREIEEGYSVASFDYNKKRLVVSYSAKRAARDRAEREAAISKIREKMAKSKNPRTYLSNYGYRKYLIINGAKDILIDEERVKRDSAFDGLHGVITNAKGICDVDVLAQYNNLWNVEDAFRVTKHDLKVRPVFHWKPKRIAAHLAISFAAYALVKYMEYRVKLQYIKLSPERIRRALVGVQMSILFDGKKRIRYGLPSKMSREARKIYNILGIKRSLTPYIIEKV